MKLSTDDILLLVKALSRSITRFESCAKAAKAGKAGYNIQNNLAVAEKMRALRERLLQSEGAR